MPDQAPIQIDELGQETEVQPKPTSTARKTVRKSRVTMTGCKRVVDMAATIMQVVAIKIGKPDWALSDAEQKALKNSLYETAKSSIYINRFLEWTDKLTSTQSLAPTLTAIVAVRAIDTEAAHERIPDEVGLAIGMASQTWIGIKAKDKDYIADALFEDVEYDASEVETGGTSANGRADREWENNVGAVTFRESGIYGIHQNEVG